jgi:hypothetical protein
MERRGAVTRRASSPANDARVEWIATAFDAPSPVSDADSAALAPPSSPRPAVNNQIPRYAPHLPLNNPRKMVRGVIGSGATGNSLPVRVTEEITAVWTSTQGKLLPTDAFSQCARSLDQP